jgi:tellurite resistance protein TerC
MQHNVPWWGWVAFNAFVLAMLALDLGVFHRKAGAIKMREALMRSGGWILLSLAFAVGVWWLKGPLEGPKKALEFLTGYVIEYSLSVDNIFVFVLLFAFFRVEAALQHKVLFWGIIGALVMRGILIFAGVKLIHHFEWLIYVFGAFLIFTGLKLALQKEGDAQPHENPLVRAFRRVMPVTNEYHEDKFFVFLDANGQADGGVLRRYATPLFIVLLMVETTDLIFAMDSIPAILSISNDPFIVYTSNVFAILGLRSLYFALAGLMGLFHYLKVGLSVILVFVGFKMLISHFYPIPIALALSVIVLVLALAIGASIRAMSPTQRGEVLRKIRDEA